MKRIIYSILVLLLIGTSAMAGNPKTRQNYVVGFYNLENLFDTYDDPAKRDEDFLPEGKNKWTQVKYEKKLHNMATVIADMAKKNGRFHTILGVSEIENRLVLEDLVAQPEIAAANYQIVHYDGPDRRGIDCALLYKPDQFKYIESESIPYTFDGSSIDFIMPKDEQDYFKTRDVLMVRGQIAGEDVAVYVAHLPSRVGDKKGSFQLRARGAEIIYNHSQQLMKKFPHIKIMVMGDMNDDATDISMTDFLHGKETIAEVGEADFFCPFTSMLKAGYGTLCYRGVWSIFDLILVNSNLVDGSKGLQIQKFGKGKKAFYGQIFKKPYMTTQQGQYKGYPFRTFSRGAFVGGYSDHYPTYIVIGK